MIRLGLRVIRPILDVSSRSIPAPSPVTSVAQSSAVRWLHISPVLRTTRWKRYIWTPWPWPLGLKHRKTVNLAHRPGKVRNRIKPHLPGSEEGQITGPYLKKFLALEFLRPFIGQYQGYAVCRMQCVYRMMRYYGQLHKSVLSPLEIQYAPRNHWRHSVFGKLRTLLAFVGFGGLLALEKREETDLVIDEDEMSRCVKMLEDWSTELKRGKSSAANREWENVTTHQYCSLWQKTTGSSSDVPEYRAKGTFLDLPARAFYQAQLDTDYRRQWDKLVVDLEIIDQDVQNETETLHWISQYPFPFSARDYVFQRRHHEDEENNVMVIISRSCQHPRFPPKSDYVRVNTYYSALVIRPHTTFDENGFDYVLVYMDDPNTYLPKMAVQYAARSNVPEFILKLHNAAKDLLRDANRYRVGSKLATSIRAPTASAFGLSADIE